MQPRVLCSMRHELHVPYIAADFCKQGTLQSDLPAAPSARRLFVLQGQCLKTHALGMVSELWLVWVFQCDRHAAKHGVADDTASGTMPML
jgi:hypothetical protein